MKALKRIFAFSFLLLTIMSCSKDDDNDNKEFDGSKEAIENFFSEEVLLAMEELGFIFNEGDSPPNIEGSFLVSKLQLQTSNIVTDDIGKIYADVSLTFSNQLNEELKIDYEATTGTSSQVGVQSFISGSNDRFSVFIKVNSTREGNTNVSALAYSGTLVDEGIENVQHTLIMLDDNGDPNNNLIENGQGRLFVDSDGMSPKQ